jgi:uncharacterized membrane protein YqjE
MEDPGKASGGALGEYTYPSRFNGAKRMSSERSTVDLLKDIFGNVEEIIRSEVRLAKAEIREDAVKGFGAAKLIGIGALLGLYALGFALLGVVYLLSLVVPAWGSALIVGVVVGVAAAVLVSRGREQLKKLSPKPEKTLESVKENAAWIKDQIKS